MRISFEHIDTLEKINKPVWNWEDNKGYHIIFGPSRSTQESFLKENGKVKHSSSETYTFILQFNKEGIHTIPAMSAITSKGRIIMSSPIQIRATKEKVKKHNKYVELPYFDKEKDVLVVKATTDKKRIELGDSIEYEIRLYTNKDVTRLSPISRFSINCAYLNEYKLPSSKPFENAVYQGKSVRSVLAYKAFITPIQTGDFIIEPTKFSTTLQLRKHNIDPFDAFFNNVNVYTNKDTIITTKPIRIHVDETSRPIQCDELTDYKTQHRLGIVIDRSSSLNTMTDSLSPTFSQLENSFLETLLTENNIQDYSVTFFSGRPYYSDSTDITHILNKFPSKDNDSSAVYDAILASALRDGALTKGNSPYSILLLTDGNDNSSRATESTVTNLLKAHNIRLDVVAFANKNDSILIIDPADSTSSKTLVIKNNIDYNDVKRMAKATDGMFILIENKNQIAEAVRKIARQIDKASLSEQIPDKNFRPRKELLYRLYKRIMEDSEKDF